MLPIMVFLQAADADLKPFSFRDYSVGAPAPKRGCAADKGITRCLLKDIDVGGISVDDGLATYGDDGFKSLYLRFSDGQTERFLAALTAKYGKPCNAETKEVQNGYGAKLQQRTVEWCFSDGKAWLTSPSPRIGVASFAFTVTVQPTQPKVDF